MRVADLSPESFAQLLAGSGVGVRLGPFDVSIVARVRGLAAPMYQLYLNYPLLAGERVYSIHVELHEVRSLRARPMQRVRLLVDGRAPHEDMAVGQALCVLEWGINLVIALRSHTLLMLHAAVVERGGGVLLLPAAPGAGKTTLCAGLIHRGWRLLSDEFGLLRPGLNHVLPLPRPLPLKNNSTGIIRAFAPEAFFGPLIPGTRKGDITHLRAPRESVERSADSAPVRWLVFPQWQAGEALRVDPVPTVEAFALLATNAFNYEMLGETAFDAVRTLVTSVPVYRLVYSDLETAVAAINRLAQTYEH